MFSALKIHPYLLILWSFIVYRCLNSDYLDFRSIFSLSFTFLTSEDIPLSNVESLLSRSPSFCEEDVRARTRGVLDAKCELHHCSTPRPVIYIFCFFPLSKPSHILPSLALLQILSSSLLVIACVCMHTHIYIPKYNLFTPRMLLFFCMWVFSCMCCCDLCVPAAPLLRSPAFLLPVVLCKAEAWCPLWHVLGVLVQPQLGSRVGETVCGF